MLDKILLDACVVIDYLSIFPQIFKRIKDNFAELYNVQQIAEDIHDDLLNNLVKGGVIDIIKPHADDKATIRTTMYNISNEVKITL
ncbi:MAG: hypothetical protein LBR53_10530 [Deltaproteobacteria bacterium]|jgi:hypothetical protein|nr:hypothetical protein [Deltaproteobacteria bacterium]